MQADENEDVTAKKLCEVFANSEGASQICQLITDPSTRNSQSVVDVIHNIEEIGKVHRHNRYVQSLVWWAVKGIWFGWSGTHRLPGHNPIFPAYPRNIRQSFILRSIEVGTEVAARQRQFASK